MKIDIAGEKFGRLTAIKTDGKDKNGRTLWLCKCDCGDSARAEAEKAVKNGVFDNWILKIKEEK